MDFRDSPESAAFREEVRAFLTDALAQLPGPEPATITDRKPYFQQWQELVQDAGYAGMSWPAAYGGREATLVEQAIWAEEYDRAGAPDKLNTIGEGFAGPTVIDHGTEEQKERLLPGILSGEEIWCQLFSEPAAGSDLAALETKAVRDGDGWRLSGQKVWTSRAHVSTYGICLARTGGGERHRGITYFILPMDQEGVVVRPLEHMLGEPEFNEVFLDDAYVPDDLRLGEVDKGWKVAMATLSYERVALAVGRVNLQRLMKDLTEAIRAETTADGRPLGEDPFVRRQMADFHARARVARLNGLRALDGMTKGAPGPEASIGKLLAAPLVEDLADFAVGRHGLEGQLDPEEADDAAARWLRLSYQARGTSIAGGTTFIQRNIIAERVLGLPRG